MYKVTVLYNHPVDPDSFEKYYEETHTPIALKIPKLINFELTKFIDTPNGEQAFYRMAELCFATAEDMQAALTSAEGKDAVDDLENFASGGVTFLIGNYSKAL